MYGTGRMTRGILVSDSGLVTSQRDERKGELRRRKAAHASKSSIYLSLHTYSSNSVATCQLWQQQRKKKTFNLSRRRDDRSDRPHPSHTKIRTKFKCYI